MKDLIRKYEKLKEEIQLHNYNYHALDDPKISDGEYDQLFQKLLGLEEDHPNLITPDSPSQRVGFSPIDEFKTYEHSVPMLSLANVFTEKSPLERNEILMIPSCLFSIKIAAKTIPSKESP